MNNRSKIYWLAQISGWGLLVIGNIINATIQSEFRVNTMFASLAIFLLGIGLTHFFRIMVWRLDWKRLSIPALIPRVLLASILLSALFTFFNNVLDDIASRRWPLAEVWQALMLGHELDFGFVLDIFNFAWLFFIWNILYFAVHTFESWKREEINNLKLQANQREMELKSFRAQMNPHFVFNSLNGIRALVDEDPTKAKYAITLLSGILRSNMAASRPGSGSLGSELELVEKYLALEKIRFEDRLQVIMRIDKNALEVEFPVFVLQTLVENAVKHGISKRVQGGTVEVRVEVVDEVIRIEVRNDGIYAPGRDAGIGIENSMSRLNLTFHGKSTFDIGQQAEQVVVKISIPKNKIVL